MSQEKEEWKEQHDGSRSQRKKGSDLKFDPHEVKVARLVYSPPLATKLFGTQERELRFGTREDCRSVLVVGLGV
jgi:hypothetical protein